MKRIEVIQTGLSEFWKDAEGWAPSNVAALLDKSRLDWLPSLATALNHWSKDGDLSPGELILAWANLGSLLEGTLKLFLAVYLVDYENDAELLKALNIIYRKGSKKGDPKSPDELTLPIRLLPTPTKCGVGPFPGSKARRRLARPRLPLFRAASGTR